MPEPRADLAASPFPDCVGDGVRIAIVDSGVHPDHPHIAADRLLPGTMILPDGSAHAGEDATGDRLGHGTAVTAAIQEKAPGALCLPIRVFRDELKTSAAGLVAAIRWAIDQRADIINLSLGSTNAAHRDVFAQVVEEARAAGAVIVAAREANGAPCYPGSLPSLASTDVDWDCPRDQYRLDLVEDDPVFRASGYPRPIPGVPPRRNLYGISFAVAQMSGFAALACERLHAAPTPDRPAAILHALRCEAGRISPR